MCRWLKVVGCGGVESLIEVPTLSEKHLISFSLFLFSPEQVNHCDARHKPFTSTTSTLTINLLHNVFDTDFQTGLSLSISNTHRQPLTLTYSLFYFRSVLFVWQFKDIDDGNQRKIPLQGHQRRPKSWMYASAGRTTGMSNLHTHEHEFVRCLRVCRWLLLLAYVCRCGIRLMYEWYDFYLALKVFRWTTQSRRGHSPTNVPMFQMSLFLFDTIIICCLCSGWLPPQFTQRRWINWREKFVDFVCALRFRPHLCGIRNNLHKSLCIGAQIPRHQQTVLLYYSKYCITHTHGAQRVEQYFC